MRQEIFDKYWNATKLVRDYYPNIYQATNTELHITFLGEHPDIDGTVIVATGIVNIEKPEIIDKRNAGGVEKVVGTNVSIKGGKPQSISGLMFDTLSPEPSYFALEATKELTMGDIIEGYDVTTEKGDLRAVADRYNTMLENAKDRKTGLITGIPAGINVSTLKYGLWLIVRSIQRCEEKKNI